MTTIEEARLQKAREIAAEAYEAARTGDPFPSEYLGGRAAYNAALAALVEANWQPAEDPDERAAWEIYTNGALRGSHPWGKRHESFWFRGVLEGYKAGKAAR